MVGHLKLQRSILPDHRDRFSFLDELSPEQMAVYRPDQLATLLRQREKVPSQSLLRCIFPNQPYKVHAMVQRDRMAQNGSSLQAHEGLLDLAEPMPSPHEYRKL